MTIRSVCIVGPGAIGGLMALWLKRAGFEVSALARPAKVAEIKAKGMTLHYGGATITETFRAASDAAELGPHDLVVVTTKAGALAEIAPQLEKLSKPKAPWVFVQNGVPWWFLDHFGGAHKGKQLTSVDREQTLRRFVPHDRLIWGVIHCSVSFDPDGSLRHHALNRLILGRSDSSVAGLDDVAKVFSTAGHGTEITPNIHTEIWLKLQNNITYNPISAITMATVDQMINDPLVRDLCVKVADETKAVGEALGIVAGPTGEQRFPKTSSARATTSMMSDMLRGRGLELDEIIAAMVELSDITGVPAPFTRMLYGLARLRAKTAAVN